MGKIITFAIPCYNSASYMDHCIESILEGSNYADDLQIVIVDDGSTKDNTLEKAQDWQKRYPNIVKAVHQENGGHGMAVLKGIEEADGAYFKVVDSDDWVDGEALRELLKTLRGFDETGTTVDLVITNYVYEHVEDNKSTTIDYLFALPRGRVMGWKDIGHFNTWQNLLMHALCYRTAVLRDGGVPMPAHTFYVDNIYAFVPLPRCKTLYYLDVDLYRYFIGREDQSVNESVMASRIDQQVRVTRIMMRSYHIYKDVHPVQLRSYMVGYLTIMMSVCSIFCKMTDYPNARELVDDLWQELHDFDRRMWRRCRLGIIGLSTNLPGPVGEKMTLFFYRAAQKIIKFN